MHRGSSHNLIAAILLALFLATSGCKPLMVIHSDYDRIDTAGPWPDDTTVLNMIEPFRLQLEESMDVVLAELEEDLIKEQPEGTLGNHVAEITYYSAAANYDGHIDFSVMNYGGLRVPYVSAGPLRRRDAYQIMPFDNFIVVMELDGAAVQELADRMAVYHGWPVYNMTYMIDNGKAVDVTVDGKPLEMGRYYFMAISDYLADGGDKLDMLKKFSYYNTGELVRDAIMEFWKSEADAGRTINEQKDGRVGIK